MDAVLPTCATCSQPSMGSYPSEGASRCTVRNCDQWRIRPGLLKRLWAALRGH